MRANATAGWAMALMAVPPLCLAQDPAADASAGVWKATTGFDYSSGDYDGARKTEILYLPFALSYQQGPWKTRVTVPWISIEGPGTVVGGGEGGVVVGRGRGARRTDTDTESGLGDIWVAETYSLQTRQAAPFFIDLTGKIKLPTASENDGLGTGETDFTVQVDVLKPHGRVTPMFSLAYKMKGDPPGTELDNVWYVSAGADYRASESVHYGASLDFQEASTEDADDAAELYGYASSRLTALWTSTVYGYLGLTDGSPDFGLGLQFAYRFP